MAMPTPADAAAKWAQGFGASGSRWQAGVQATTVAPGQAAARQKQLWATNTAASVDRWASRTAAVTKEQWVEACTTKGLPRLASGATAGQPKYAAAMQTWFPYIETTVRSLPPRADIEANIN